MKVLFAWLSCSLLVVLQVAGNLAHCQSNVYSWSYAFGTDITFGEHVTHDKFGNVFFVGHFTGSIDADPGSSVHMHYATYQNGIYIIKLDSLGNHLWSRSISGTSIQWPRGIQCDSLGALYIAGGFYESIDMNPDSSAVDVHYSQGSLDVFFMKLDSGGNYIWGKTIGGAYLDDCVGIELDDSLNIVIAGGFKDSVDFDPNIGVQMRYAEGNFRDHIYAAKYNNNGEFVWAETIGNHNGNNYVTSFSLDKYGDLYFTGRFVGTLDFDPSNGINSKSSNGDNDIFICKWKSSGQFDWVQSIGGIDYDAGRIITTDNYQNVYITGEFRSASADFNPGLGTSNLFNPYQGWDMFILRLDVSGEFEQVWQSSGYGTGWSSTTPIKSMIATDDGELYIHCNSGLADFDPDPNQFFVSSGKVIYKSDTSGQLLWVKSLKIASFYSQGNIDVMSNKDIYVTGGCQYFSDLDPGPDTVLADSNHAFLLKLSSCPTSYGIDSIVSCDSLIWENGLVFSSDTSGFKAIISSESNCDSIITLNLEIMHSTYAIDTITTCDSITWIDGNVYTQNNYSAIYPLINSQGCDSIVTLNLTIDNDVSVTESIESCGSYTWIDGNTYASDNSTAVHVVPGINGCDTIKQLDLEIHPSYYLVDTVFDCDSHTWMNGVTYNSDALDVYYIDTTVHGCDSIWSLNLTINYSDTVTDSIISCGPISWIDGNTYFESNSSAMVSFISSQGCDSTIRLNLEVRSDSVVENRVECGPFTWINGITYFNDNDTSCLSYINSFGCDSIVCLDLTISSFDTTVLNFDSILFSQDNNSDYQWIMCDPEIILNSENNQFLKPPVGGMYAVVLSNENCIDTSECLQYVPLGAASIKDRLEVLVYPNPSKGVFTIHSSERILGLEIYDTLGRIVFQKDAIEATSFECDHFLSNGVYLMKVKINSTSVYKELIISR